MASNDSNEPGNAAAAQTAFQVGDRVRCIENPVHEFGVVVEPDEPGYVLVEMAANSLAPGARLHYRPDQLIIISRATPAPAPAQTVDIDAATAEFESWNPWGNKRPVVVCLCGSTRFSKAFREANLRETLEGRIVLSIGCDMRSDTEIFGEMTPDELADIKRRLDDLHKRKIDLADEILVLNLGGYIGESTASEIAYAKAHGKTIRYLETTGGLPTQPGETPDMAEPATPAPAATPPALDTHTLDLPVMVRCTACDGSGTERHGEGHLPCPYCAGLGYSDMHIRLSDEAVDRLAGELVKRISKRLDPHIHPLRNARY